MRPTRFAELGIVAVTIASAALPVSPAWAAPPKPTDFPAPDDRIVYISVGADAVATALQVTRAGFAASSTPRPAPEIESNHELAVLAIREADLEALSEAMHEQHHRCGGFMLHESLDDARASFHVEATDGGEEEEIDYRLTRGPAVRALLPRLSAERIRQTIAEMSAMHNRYWRSASGANTSVWLGDLWRSFSSRSDVTVDLVDHGYPQKSVILTIPGTSRPEQVVVIGGHLDSIARGGVDARAPGADDDASGIATLTEVARVLLASDFRPERTVKFIGYAAEEVGLRGSLAISRDYKARKVNVVGVLQLDMTNFQGSDKDIWLINDFTSPKQNAFLIELITTYLDDVTYGIDRCGYACSDHAAWHRAGYRASMPFESRFRHANKRIHTARDTLETSDANAAHAIKFARLATAYAIELGKSTQAATHAEPESASPGMSARAACGADRTWLWLTVHAMFGVAALLLTRRMVTRKG